MREITLRAWFGSKGL